MRVFVRLVAIAIAGSAMTGCSSITVTADTIVDGTARIADATTNAVEGTSAVTTNTANDVDARTHAARAEFVDSQMAMIKREAARGQGENLDTLAYMMHAGDIQAFNAQLQANYETLFSGDAPAEQWLARLYGVVGTPPDMTASADRTGAAAS